MANNQEHYDAYKKGILTFPTIYIVLKLIDYKFNIIPEIVLVISAGTIWQYIWFCRYVDPDLDQVTLTGAEGRMRRELPIIGIIFILWWLIYAFLLNALAIITGTSHGRLGAHRTFWSHSKFGTFLRWVWLNIPIVYIFQRWNLNFTSTYMELPVYNLVIYLFTNLIVLSYGDSKHYKLDNL